MDLALTFNPELQAVDLALDGADLATEDTLASSVLASLLCDRLVEGYEVPPGADRRGWWADAYAETPHKTGSRLWLLERNKQLPSIVKRCEQYCQEALAWMVTDRLCAAVTITAFAVPGSALVAMIKLDLPSGSRNFRFEFDEARQLWRLAGEQS
jgi:phage gp46-like protein